MEEMGRDVLYIMGLMIDMYIYNKLTEKIYVYRYVYIHTDICMYREKYAVYNWTNGRYVYR